MRLELARAWAVIAILPIQIAVVWELWRTRVESDVRDARLLIVLAFTLLLTGALRVWERRANRRLAGGVQVADDELCRAMESGHAVAWDWDVKSGRDVFFGDLKTMFGIDAQRHVGHIDDFRRYIHQDDRETVWRAVVEARDGHTGYLATYRVVWPDGTVRWVAASGKFYYTDDGAPLRMLGIATDVTGRHVIEDQLRESQERLTGIVQSAMDAIIAIDDEERITVFNRAAETMFGCTAADALGTSIGRFIPPRFLAVHSAHVRRFGEAGVKTRSMGALGQLWAVRVGGDEFPIEASISQTEAGGRKLYTVVVRDVTERSRAEEALRESEERFRLMADNAPVMLWMSGTDMLCNYFNRSWLEFTGRSLDAELGNGWADGVHSEDMKRCLTTYQVAFDKREAFTVEYRLRRHDGEYRWVLDNGAPRFAPDGSFAGYFGSCVDVTTQKVAHAALADLSHKLMDAQDVERARLARELHDDIGQRIAVLTMEIDGLDLALPLSMADLRIRIGTLSNRARDLSKDIQAISRSLHSSKLDYLGIVSACAGLCRELSEQQRVDIDFSHDGIPDEVPKDLALCTFRVLQEAVTNAVKHAGVDQVTVALRGVGDEIHLEVADNGIGFDPVAAIRGSGLGLISMTERLNLVMGELSIESRPGAGATIRARMPLSRSVGLSAGASG